MLLSFHFLPTYTDFQFKYKIRLDPKNELTVIGLGAKMILALNLKANETEFQRYILDFIPVQEQYSYVLDWFINISGRMVMIPGY